MGYVHRECKHILGLFSKNNEERLDKHSSAKTNQNKFPRQAKRDATNSAFQTNSEQIPEHDHISSNSEVEISRARINKLVGEQSHGNAYIEKVDFNF